MGYDLKDFKFAKKFQMSDDKEQNTAMKNDQKHPQNRLVPSHRWKQKRVKQGPQPSGPFFGKYLQRAGMLGFPKNLNQSYSRANQKDRKGHVDHGHQDNIIQGLHGNLP